MVERGLGRGLRHLLSKTESQSSGGVDQIDINSIVPNRLQPRRSFDPALIAELVDSIREHGVLQPVVLRRLSDDRYELIAGERRFISAKELGFEKIPAIIKEAISDKEALELALVENLQRSDLSPIEKAKAFHQLAQEFKLTHEQVGKRVGLDRSSVSNFVRLMELAPELQEAVSRGTISMGHARALLSLPGKETQVLYLKKITDRNLSVRATEALVQQGLGLLKLGTGKKGKRREALPAWLLELESSVQKTLGERVKIDRARSGRGRVVVEFATDKDLDRIAKKLLTLRPESL